jgi:selenoprotein W-related protein
LVNSSGGAFEVSVDGVVVFSKLQTGRHAKPGEVARLIETARKVSSPGDDTSK